VKFAAMCKGTGILWFIWIFQMIKKEKLPEKVIERSGES